METRHKKVCVHFVQDENVQNLILPVEPGKNKSRGQGSAKSTRKPQEQAENNSIGASTDKIRNGPELHPTLFCEDTDVTGLEMFGMKTTTRSSFNSKLAGAKMDSLDNHSPKTPTSARKALKRTSKCDSPKTKPKTPLSSLKVKPGKTEIIQEPSKTPYNTRRKIKYELARRTQAVELGASSDSDFSPSDSEASSEADDVDDDSEEDQKPVTTVEATPTSSRRMSLRQKERNQDDLKYVIDSDEYFRLGKTKARTSNHTLSKLKTPTLPPDEVRKLLEGTKQTHEQPIKNLLEEQKQTFRKWMFVLNEGYSVLAYGVGSKRTLLNAFHTEAVNFPVLVCNGYFPSLTVNQIVEAITDGILGAKESRSLGDSIELVERSFRAGSKNRMALVIHNIDGPCLRSAKNQGILSRIASLRNVWLVASVDHINGPAMWDQTMLSDLNLTYWDATSLLPYTEETSFESSLLVQRTGALMLSSLSNVFQSLTTNAQGIFMVIVDYQLTRGKAKRPYLGMQFKDLYRSCRDKMLVSSDQTLRAQLTEFLDHKLILSKRGQGGSEMLTVPLEDSLLETFLEQRGEE